MERRARQKGPYQQSSEQEEASQQHRRHSRCLVGAQGSIHAREAIRHEKNRWTKKEVAARQGSAAAILNFMFSTGTPIRRLGAPDALTGFHFALNFHGYPPFSDLSSCRRQELFNWLWPFLNHALQGLPKNSKNCVFCRHVGLVQLLAALCSYSFERELLRSARAACEPGFFLARCSYLSYSEIYSLNKLFSQNKRVGFFLPRYRAVLRLAPIT